jgi:peroxiredoxin
MRTSQMSSLTEALAEQRFASRAQMSEEAWEVVEKATDRMRRENVAAGAVAAGDTAPSFTLPNAKGTDVSLDDLLDEGPVVLSFFRGGWCPYCGLELRALQKASTDIREAGGNLVAVSPQSPKSSFQTQRQNELDFDVLSDDGLAVASDYGLVFDVPSDLKTVYRDEFGIDLTEENADGSWRLPVPATYVINRDQTVAYAFAEADYTHRATPEQIIDTLKELR